MKSLYGLAFAAAGLLAACGGDVRVDGEPGSASQGQGGAGASSSSSSSSTSTTPSTSTGPLPSTSSTGPMPACDCFGACQKLVDCGFGDIPCQEFCQAAPPDAWQCVCNTPDCNVDFCFGGTGGVGGSGGGGPTPECAECVNELVDSTCSQQSDACFSDPQCVEILQCHEDCGWTPRCNEKCDASFPGGFPEFQGFISCLVCGECFDPCNNTSLVNYCFDG